MAHDSGPLVLLFGANGQVGYELRRTLMPLGRVVVLDRRSADLRDAEAIRAVIRKFNPQIIVNGAAYTQVDRAETDADTAYLVNAVAPGVMAMEAAALDACIVHYSTDYVFDGRQRAAYVESDATNPLSVYGATKLAGERSVSANCARHVIFRASWVFGAHGANFLKTIVRLASECSSLRIVSDQHGAPTSAGLISHVTARVLSSMENASCNDPRWGLYHLSASGLVSWHGYACHIVTTGRRLGMHLLPTTEDIIAIASQDYPTAASRPANSALETRKLAATFGLTLPDWRNGVDEVLVQMNNGDAS
jgi:dTDP-4-dehydrorhamnose reductase